MGGLMKRHPLVGWMFFIVAWLWSASRPLADSLARFLSSAVVLSEGHFWLTGLALASSLAVLYSLIKVFMGAFWGESPGHTESQPVRIHRTAYVAAIGLTVMVIVLGVGSGGFIPTPLKQAPYYPIHHYTLTLY